ncbi:MAG: hypothetical protein LAT62_11220 [Natronospirillum sp.]|uniref:DUF6685 family protein n=1 Tax=Natronospirillum sp. TaxID=2812955 RepID=UPI0025F2EF53|nr:DUF6685 family protein [Natronospirillum sp.]MCH8552500.1 hypothetical protein [Natronospirillum sp.]
MGNIHGAVNALARSVMPDSYLVGNIRLREDLPDLPSRWSYHVNGRSRLALEGFSSLRVRPGYRDGHNQAIAALREWVEIEHWASFRALTQFSGCMASRAFSGDWADPENTPSTLSDWARIVLQSPDFSGWADLSDEEMFMSAMPHVRARTDSGVAAVTDSWSERWWLENKDASHHFAIACHLAQKLGSSATIDDLPHKRFFLNTGALDRAIHFCDIALLPASSSSVFLGDIVGLPASLPEETVAREIGLAVFPVDLDHPTKCFHLILVDRSARRADVGQRALAEGRARGVLWSLERVSSIQFHNSPAPSELPKGTPHTPFVPE